MKSNRRTFLAASIAAASTLVAVTQSRAADLASKPITLVIGYSAGGPTDVLARAMAPLLANELKQQVIVDNRPGANEMIAAQLVSKAPPDGHTLLMCTESPLTQTQFLYRKIQYNPEKDFAPVTHLATSPLALIVNPSLPVTTVEEFIALAKSRAAANRPLSYGSAGIGGTLHLPMSMFAKEQGLNLLHVPYKGLAPVFTDLIAGQIDAAWAAPAGAAPYVREGKLRALVIDAPSRVKALPQVPVFGETKVNRIQANFHLVLMGPAGTPPAVAEKVAAAVRRILQDPAFRERYLDPYAFLPVGSTPAELAAFLTKERPLQAERVRASGAVLD